MSETAGGFLGFIDDIGGRVLSVLIGSAAARKEGTEPAKVRLRFGSWIFGLAFGIVVYIVFRMFGPYDGFMAPVWGILGVLTVPFVTERLFAAHQRALYEQSSSVSDDKR